MLGLMPRRDRTAARFFGCQNTDDFHGFLPFFARNPDRFPCRVDGDEQNLISIIFVPTQENLFADSNEKEVFSRLKLGVWSDAQHRTRDANAVHDGRLD